MGTSPGILASWLQRGYTCHAKAVSTLKSYCRCHQVLPATQKPAAPKSNQRRPSAPPEPAQCHKCHGCHAKAAQSSVDVTKYHVLRKSDVDVTKSHACHSQATVDVTKCHACHKARRAQTGPIDVTECHACHAKADV